MAAQLATLALEGKDPRVGENVADITQRPRQYPLLCYRPNASELPIPPFYRKEDPV